MADKKNALMEIVGAEKVTDDPAALAVYAGDGGVAPSVKPLMAVMPGSADEVQSIVKWANQTATPLVPVSSGPPHLRGGTVPGAEGAVVVDLSRMDRIIMTDRRNRVTIIEPGVTYSKLQPELAKQGLRLSMPLLPRGSKSVLGSVLDREPILNPRYAWSLSEPLRCIETVMGTGDMFRTGELAGANVSTSAGQEVKYIPLEELLEKRRKTQETALYQYGPGQFNYHKLVSAAQGTMGIVTWASLRCEVLPKVQRFFLVPSETPDPLIGFAYKLLRIRFHDELMLFSRATLASILGEDAARITGLREKLPPWVLFLALSGRDTLPQERVDFMQQDISEFAREFGLCPESGVPGAEAEQVGQTVLNPAKDPYWKFRFKGGCREIFFLTTLNRVPEFIAKMAALAEASQYPAADIGVYVQPTHLGTSCHVEFVLPFDPGSAAASDRMQTLFTRASRELSELGAFYSRPYGIWAEMAYGRNPEHAALTKELKKLFDPGNVLNPGKLLR